MPDKVAVLFTGQSNAVRRQPNANWTPAPSTYIWNNTVGDPTSTGNAFVPVSTVGNLVGESFVSRMAEEYPDKEFYLITCGRGGTDISGWLPGGTYDVYGGCKTNVEAALTAIGLDHISMYAMWHGETNGWLTSYPDDHSAVHDRFEGEVWIKPETPLMVFGTADEARGGDPKYNTVNRHLQEVVARKTNAVFIPTYEMTDNSLWDDNVHVSQAGYDVVARMAFNILNGHSNRHAYSMVNPWTPEIIGFNGAYSTQWGFYHRDGPVVHFNGGLNWSGHTGGGLFALSYPTSGVPFSQDIISVFPQSGLPTGGDLRGRTAGSQGIVIFEGNSGLSIPASGNMQFQGWYFLNDLFN